MCGIAGFVTGKRIDAEEVLERMGRTLNHRGPDGKGFFFDEKAGLGFSHARLSVIDLTETGHQPMTSETGRFVVAYNGEIYNHLELRKKIDEETGTFWKGDSDTETLLRAFEIWGIPQTLSQLVGMFAIALFDKKNQLLYLIRDRMGEKPLYYGDVNGSFVFGSELWPIYVFPGFVNEISRDAVALYMKHGSIPDPYSIFENVHKLTPGTTLTYEIETGQITKAVYWSASEQYKQNQSNLFEGTAEEGIRLLDKKIRNAVDIQMHTTDVPIGAFLSGGVDSSLISAMMQSMSNVPINTFSIGFDVPEYNEAEYAKKVAQHLGTNHYEKYVTGKDALDVVPEIPKIYAEPFSESSQIPTFLVSKIAKEKVTVCLSGDAGDELFGGYERYRLANNTWNKISRIPSIGRNFVSKGIKAAPYDLLYGLLSGLKRTNSTGKQINFADKLVKFAPLLQFTNRGDFYSKGFLTHNLAAENWVNGSKGVATVLSEGEFNFDSFYDEMMAMDQISYLPNNNLVKVDRSAMANSLEVRVPMLDFRVIDFAQSLPVTLKIHNGKMKWILRQVLYQYVPEYLIERPKMGFGVPLAHWLRNDLRDWTENLIDQKALSEQGVFNTRLVRNAWKDHLSGKKNMEYFLWDVLVFQSWVENQKTLSNVK